eukprot:TRINITY_DN10692_c0_g1_i1.p4 TRINITY_DN10692_c0_g1~~TRINITY_DN10692_c0_g1_i1.p4  ORF type:complete len:100 (+),score=15.90 TRINITY_DN10692_c0_g1_i1:348-647(+)
MLVQRLQQTNETVKSLKAEIETLSEEDKERKNNLQILKKINRDRRRQVEDLINMISILYRTGQWVNTYPRKELPMRMPRVLNKEQFQKSSYWDLSLIHI